MTNDQDRPPWTPNDLLLGILLWLAIGVLAAVVLIVRVLVDLAVVVLALYLAVLIFSLLTFPLIDLISRFAEGRLLERRRCRSIASTQFPDFHLMRDPTTVDAIGWKMIVFTIGVWSVQGKNEATSYDDACARVQRCVALRDKLASNEVFFQRWRMDNLQAVLDDPFNQSVLASIYNHLWDLYRDGAQSMRPGQWQKIHDKLRSLALPQETFFLTKKVLGFLSWKVLFKGIGSPAPTVLRAHSDASMFRQLMYFAFVELAGELSPLRLGAEPVVDDYEPIAREQGHYLPPPPPPAPRAALPSNAAPTPVVGARDEADVDHQIRELREQMRESERLHRELQEQQRQEEIARLRDVYVTETLQNPSVLHALHRAGHNPFAGDIQSLIREQVGDDPVQLQDRLARLEIEHNFVSFWRAHEFWMLLKHHHRTIAEREIARHTADQQRQQEEEERRTRAPREWVDRTVEVIARLARREHPPREPNDADFEAYATHGFLLSCSWQEEVSRAGGRVRDRARLPAHARALLEGRPDYDTRQYHPSGQHGPAVDTFFHQAGEKAARRCLAYLNNQLLVGPRLASALRSGDQNDMMIVRTLFRQADTFDADLEQFQREFLRQHRHSMSREMKQIIADLGRDLNTITENEFIQLWKQNSGEFNTDRKVLEFQDSLTENSAKVL